MQKLFRFELSFDGTPQNVGLLQGLTDIGLEPFLEAELYAQFDTLPIVELDCEEKISFWFTETGLKKFSGAIDRIIDAIAETGWTLIGNCIQDDLSEAIYRDEFQAAFPYSYTAGRGDYIEMNDITKFAER